MKSKLLIEENQLLEESGAYIAYVILDSLQKSGKVSIFDVYELLKKKISNVNSSNVMDGLVLLHMLGAVEFKSPYIVITESK